MQVGDLKGKLVLFKLRIRDMNWGFGGMEKAI